MAQGHPQHAMQLADAVWRLVAPGETADPEVWASAVADVRRSVDPVSERIYELLPLGQRRVLRTVAEGGSIYGRAAARVDLAPATARGASDALIGKGILARREERIEIVDPLLTDWLRCRFQWWRHGFG